MTGHLVKGLLILAGRWSARPRVWVAAGENWLDKLIRGVMLAAAGLVVFRVLTVSLVVLGVAVLVVCVMALHAATKAARAGASAPVDAAPAAPAEAAVEPPADGLPEVSQAEFVALIRDVLGTLNGVHLATLATALTVRVGGAWEIADVRALAEATGVPVRPAVRGLGKRVSPGVHRGDLPPLPDPSPATIPGLRSSVVAAGQPGTTAPTTGPATTVPATTDRVVGGLRIITTDDPENPARARVTVIDPARTKRT